LQYRGERPAGRAVIYQPELQGPFPKFSTWLYSHVQRLRHENFPTPTEVVNLSCGPDPIAWSLHSMWAYGAHYRCDSEEGGPSHVTFDSGIAHIMEETLCSQIDVAILRSILLVSFGSFSCVVLEGSWISGKHEGKDNVRKDCHGFWTVGYSNRDNNESQIPFVFPEKICQVSFMDDSEDPNLKVVLQHEPRERRTMEDKDLPFYGAPGSAEGSLVIPPVNHGRGLDVGSDS
jgi:hypothetical protein